MRFGVLFVEVSEVWVDVNAFSGWGKLAVRRITKMPGYTLGPIERVATTAVVYAVWGGLAGLYLGFGFSDSPWVRIGFFAALGAAVGAILSAAEQFDESRRRTPRPLTTIRWIGGLFLLLLMPFLGSAIDGRDIRWFDFVWPVVMGLWLWSSRRRVPGR